MKGWDDLEYWSSLPWELIQEKLDALEAKKIAYNPARENLFAALDAVPFDKVRVVIIGQDPYPAAEYATGIAFSIPRNVKVFPPTLDNIFQEYQDDLHYPKPGHGCLDKWTSQGVLLWNATPTCETGHPCSHRSWDEWSYLTIEIVQKLSERKGIVFVLLGGNAHRLVPFIELENEIIQTSHPSPLGASRTKSPFLGSRIFSTINAKLKNNPIDWRL